ncbi:MAG: hypothetical protein M3526_05050 [Actinomycetota bacterium]|nr:hypothetical protein [Actinomycetota bacterium]
MRTLVVPRGLTSKLALLVNRLFTRHLFLWLARRFDDYEAKDRILAFAGPLSLLMLLSVWMFSFWMAFALMLWPLIPLGWLEALRESGSSMLTLGFASQPDWAPTAVMFVAASTGLIVVALQVAYLPTLYGAFNRRESLVTLLQSRAGAPAWGPELLTRHVVVGLVDNLGQLYLDWEEWAADVAESHTSYPVLVWFRSPHPLRSWVIALLAVLDSAAMYLALSPNAAPTQTRLCLRMGFTALRNIADVTGIPYDPDPLPTEDIELDYEDFLGGVHRLRDQGFQLERSAEEAWPDFKGWRVNYESICYALADMTVAVPGPWTGSRTHLRDVTIVPERPANRRPDDPREEEEPKATRFGWRV